MSLIRSRIIYTKLINVVFRYSGFYQFFTPTLVIKDSELLKRITVKDFNYFNDHSQFVPEYIDSIWAKNLFILRGISFY